MTDTIRTLDLRGPGWKMRIDLEEFFIQPGVQLSRLLKMLEKAESHNALEPAGCGDVLTCTPRILAAVILLEAEIPKRLTDDRYVARQRKRRLQAAQKRMTAHKELILKWIQTQK